MIPLKDPVYRAYQFSAALKGSAIAGDEPYEIHFDTGSWTTSIPGGALDFSQVKVITQDVTTDWGRPADLVEGQLALESVDGTVYSIDNFRFYALKESLGGDYLPDDRTAIYGNGAIMGGFPSPNPYRSQQSFPFLLAQKYAADRMGLGIVSTCENLDFVRLHAGWGHLDSYLQIGKTPEITDHLFWRSDIPKWINQSGFYPEAVPGFQVAVDFSDTSERIVTADNLIATVDTGAPDLTLRLDSSDPQYSANLAHHFVNDGPWTRWNNSRYMAAATTLIDGTVTVYFTDDNGFQQSYSFEVGSDPNPPLISPASLFAGRWTGEVPWTYSLPSFPRNRINLGNSIYFFWPVYFWDIENERVGIGTRASSATNVESSLPIQLGETGSYPNPFSKTATIQFELAEPSIVHLAVYDILGREVAVLASDYFSAGLSEIDWDASTFPNGIYMYRLTAGEQSATGRMMLAR